MKRRPLFTTLIVLALLFGISNTVVADEEDCANTIKIFKESEAVQPFFNDAYGYAVFPVIGKGGFGVGAAYGKGLVYRGGVVRGETSLKKLSIGFQAGGQAFSEIIFFQDEQAYNQFISGEFEFDATASAVAVTAGAEAKAGTQGTSAGMSAGPATGKKAQSSYYKGMAVFVHTKGGFMYEAAIGGQKFSYKPW